MLGRWNLSATSVALDYDAGFMDGAVSEQKRIGDQVALSLALYGGFYPDIAKVLWSVMDGVDPIRSAEMKKSVNYDG